MCTRIPPRDGLVDPRHENSPVRCRARPLKNTLTPGASRRRPTPHKACANQIRIRMRRSRLIGDDDPSGKSRRQRRGRAAGSPFAGGVVVVAVLCVLVFMILGLRWTGILDRKTLSSLDVGKVVIDLHESVLAVQRDSSAHRDGVELEYNAQLCTVSLARAAAVDGPLRAAIAAAATRGGVSAEQVWTPYIVPVAGVHDSVDAVEVWRKRASAAVSRLLTAVQDAGVMPTGLLTSREHARAVLGGNTVAPATVLIGSCGLGALQEAAITALQGAARVVCTEQAAAETAIASEHLQRRLHGRSLLASSVVLGSGPALSPRLGSALNGTLSLVLSPLESTFLKVSARLSGWASATILGIAARKR